MKRLTTFCLMALMSISMFAESAYLPTQANLQSRQEFRDMKFGIFIHWGLYSMLGQGEWYMSQKDIPYSEYSLLAGAFYPAGFDADEWVRNIKASGAKYICFTSRHHEGFSMWNTKQSDYNIVKATPFHRDILKELSKACHKYGIRLHLYYSLVDWGREDYPVGKSGKGCGKDPSKADYPHYLAFMKAQLTELLTEYGPIGAIWLDGEWDHAKDSVPFDWHMNEIYDLIHSLQPRCLVANNHHHSICPGEDMQCFEGDVPSENNRFFSGNLVISNEVPLETCETMIQSAWGYSIVDRTYFPLEQIRTMRDNINQMGANLLLNIGPRPDGRFPEQTIEYLKDML